MFAQLGRMSYGVMRGKPFFLFSAISAIWFNAGSRVQVLHSEARGSPVWALVWRLSCPKAKKLFDREGMSYEEW